MLTNRQSVEILRAENYQLYKQIYQAAQDVRQDLKDMWCSVPEKRNIAVFSVHDDLDAFMKLVRQGNRYLKETHGLYLIGYDDYLQTRGGKYALSKEIVSVMDEASTQARRMQKAVNQ